MKKRTLVALSLCIGCSGAPEVDDVAKDGVNNATSSVNDLAACQAAATEARAKIEMLNTSNPTNGSNAAAVYRQFDAARTAWEASSAPCETEGADVMERAKLASDVNKEFKSASADYTERTARALQDKPEDAWAFIEGRFATGREISDGASEAAKDIALPLNQAKLAKFKEHKKLGKIDKEFATTCVFSNEKIDPNQPPELNFTTVFSGKQVHAVCRLPLPASKYAGDANGQIFLMLDNDKDLANGVVSEGNLGTVEKWKETQYFTGRFSMPQGLEAPKDKAAYYHVTVLIKRPELGDETAVQGGFVWYAE